MPSSKWFASSLGSLMDCSTQENVGWDTDLGEALLN